MSEVLNFKKTDRDGTACFELAGVINEEVDLGFMSELPEGDVIIDSKNVERINSCGVREWIQSLKTVPEGVNLIYEGCSAAFLDQINMISNFIGDGKVKSIYIPYVCESCDGKQDVLVDLDECLVDEELELPELTCTECDEEMELGDDPDQLFSFLE
jgi:hypothetical protein